MPKPRRSKKPASFRGKEFLVEEPRPRPNYDRRGKIAIAAGSAVVLFLAGVLFARDVLGDGCRVVESEVGPGGLKLELLQCRDARQVRLTAPEGYQPPAPPSPRELEAMR